MMRAVETPSRVRRSTMAWAQVPTSGCTRMAAPVSRCPIAAAIVALLTREGVSTERIILAHLDRNPDFELHAEVAGRGVVLEYDTPGRIKYRPDSQLIDLIEEMAAAGHIDRLLLGLDLGMRDYFRAFGGGPGLAYLMETFVPRLRNRIGEEAARKILVDNAATAFALSG